MELIFGETDFRRQPNKVNRLPYHIAWIPLVTVATYFSKYENIYFLLLAIVQLLTLGPFPSTWSPTGPFGTALPLLIFVLAEIVMAIAKWIDIKRKDQQENNKKYRVSIGGNLCWMKNEELRPGHVLCLEKNDICPIDGILLDVENDSYAKISMALLTGESNIHHISKPTNLCLCDYWDAKLVMDNILDYQSVSGKIMVSKKVIPINKNNYIMAGSIMKSETVFIWTVACGSDRINKISKKNNYKSSRIDQFVGNYMMSVSVYQLVAMILVSSLAKTVYLGADFITFLICCIQSWILFNGIIPFSVKIFLVLARYVEGKLADSVTVNESLQIDDFGKIKKIVCDKTGTVTKNKLQFVKLICSGSNKIVNVPNFSPMMDPLPDQVYHCLGLCINKSENDFATAEDKIIFDGFQRLGGDISEENSTMLKYYGREVKFVKLETLELNFTFDRKMSSCVVKSGTDYFIYTKGAIDTIRTRVLNQKDLDSCEKIITEVHPELRLLAIAYRKLDQFDLHQMVGSKDHQFLENNLVFLGIIGIRDVLQPMVAQTVENLKNYGIHFSLCTGDRRITALAVAKEIGMLGDEDAVDFKENRDPGFYFNRTMVFNGDTMKQTICSKNFLESLFHCQNFIGYNMTPESKKMVVELLESQNLPILAVGDGFNDLGMFDKASISVSIKGNNFIETYTDFAINRFSDISQLFQISTISYLKNSTLINFTFYRTAIVVFAIAAYCLIHYDAEYRSPFNAFVLQAFNFAWTIFGLAYLIIQKRETKPRDFSIQKSFHLTSNQYTTKASLRGAITGIVLVCLSYYLFYFSVNYHNILAIILILILNWEIFNLVPKDWISALACLAGVGLYIFYFWLMHLPFD